MSYWEEEMKIAEETLNLAKTGFVEKVHLAADDLLYCSYKEAKGILTDLKLAMVVMEKLEEDLEYAKEKHEMEKEDAK